MAFVVYKIVRLAAVMFKVINFLLCEMGKTTLSPLKMYFYVNFSFLIIHLTEMPQMSLEKSVAYFLST